MRISCNVGFLGVLTVAFVALKLCGIIAWPWWIVLLPLMAIVLIYAVAYGTLALVLLVYVSALCAGHSIRVTKLRKGGNG